MNNNLHICTEFITSFFTYIIKIFDYQVYLTGSFLNIKLITPEISLLCLISLIYWKVIFLPFRSTTFCKALYNILHHIKCLLHTYTVTNISVWTRAHLCYKIAISYTVQHFTSKVSKNPNITSKTFKVCNVWTCTLTYDAMPLRIIKAPID